MLTQIDVDCDNPFYMSVLGANPRDSLIIESVTGLGPPDISLFVGDYARDGGVYTGRRVSTRNPVFTIGINPNFGNGETAAGLREMLYRAFVDPSAGGLEPDKVVLILHDDVKPDRWIGGYTEKFETEPFSKDLSVNISMICPDPYIRDVAETVVDAAASGVNGWQTVPFDYQGTAETGFEAVINITATTQLLTLDNNGNKMVLAYSSFHPGDTVYINTNRGERNITLTQAGSSQALDVVYTLSQDSDWLELHSQHNSLQVYGGSETDIVASITNLKYTQRYWGV